MSGRLTGFALAHGFPAVCIRLYCFYRCDADGAPSFIKADAPTDDELHGLLQTVTARLMKMLTRRDVLVEAMGQTYLVERDSDGEEARTLRPLQAAAITYRIAFGPHGAEGADSARSDAARGCGGSAVLRQHRRLQPARCRAGRGARPQRLKQRCRYITRPALSDERVQLNAAGQVELKLKTPWRDGTPHLVMSPLELMQRLAALVRWSRQHMTGWPNSGRSPAAAPGRLMPLMHGRFAPSIWSTRAPNPVLLRTERFACRLCRQHHRSRDESMMHGRQPCRGETCSLGLLYAFSFGTPVQHAPDE